MSTQTKSVIERSETRAGRRMFLPCAVGLVALYVLPTVVSFGLSLARWDGLALDTSLQWVGLEHFRALVLDDEQFHIAAKNSVTYALAAAPLSLVAALAVALLLDQPTRSASVARAMVYLPQVLGGVAVVMIWSWLLNPRFGPVNQTLRLAGDGIEALLAAVGWQGVQAPDPPRWFHSPAWCKPALVLMQVWSFGGAMLVFLAALRQMPAGLGEAAELDGASRLRRFGSITLPLLSPVIVFVFVTEMVVSMRAFHQPYLLSHPAQDDGLLMIVPLLYAAAFEPPYRVGYACAMAWLLFAMLGLLLFAALVVAGRWVHQEYEARA